MQGLMVVPIFAGFDLASRRGRLWDYDATGGRYEERDFVATGSGMLHAGAVLRLSWKRDLSTDAAVELVSRALWEAADADSATGGPDVARGIFPTVATITADGFRRVADGVLAQIYAEIVSKVERA
jgi:proteasome beta subunit